MKIAVVGAGIVGVTTAYFLAKKGYEVTIFDREPAAAMACSRANGGQMSVCNAETWNTFKNVKKGLGWMFKKDAPLLIRPAPTLAKMKWLAGFLRHTFNGTHLLNTHHTISMGLHARTLYDQIIDDEGIKFDRRQEGLLHVYTNQESYSEALKMQRFFEESGVEWFPVNANEIRAHDPAMENFRGLVGGIHTPSDWTGDAHMFSNELLRVCEEKYGVRVMLGHKVTRIDNKVIIKSEAGETSTDFERIVLCNGHEITKFAAKLGDSLNIYPVKGYSITIDGVGDTAPGISLLDDDRKIVSAKLGDRLRVAGTAELAGVDYDIRRDRIEPLLQWVRTNFPDVDTANYSAWACLRPMNSNMMPIIKESKVAGVWYHGGHGHLGWTLAPATAHALAETLT